MKSQILGALCCTALMLGAYTHAHAATVTHHIDYDLNLPRHIGILADRNVRVGAGQHMQHTRFEQNRR